MVLPFKKIKSKIKTTILHSEIIHFKSIDSTNKYLLDKHSHPNGTVVLADFQTAGRGRRQRIWQSPEAESLLFSIFLNENIQTIPLYLLTFLAAVSVYEGLLPFIPQKHIALKWPNDVLINGKKVCGILVETKTSANRINSIVIGIGINVNQNSEFFKGELKNASSLFCSKGCKFSRMEVLSSVLVSIDKNLMELQQCVYTDFLAKWRNYCPYLGKKIKVDDGKNIYKGTFKDISQNGGLILETNGKEKIFHAADVSIVKENRNL